ncbi:MAG TPA: TcpQ domain-containing protein [Patescibacteria group bacterium]|nr:TcpQ domain-containing protein [Patescibacteria group bacterium]
MTQVNLLKKAVLFSGVAIIAFAASAQAGFEWKGPLTPPPAAVIVAPPVDTNPSDDLTPVTSWSKDDPAGAPAVVTPMPAPVAVQPMETIPAPVASAPVVSAPAAMTPVHDMSAPAHDMAATPAPMHNAEVSGDVLSGFGSDVPLVIALQQVVPAGYQYSFSSGVNPGVSVSWEGGKPWQGVLSDMLAKQGLGYRIQGSAVVIGNYASPEAPQSAAMDSSAAMASTPESDAAAGMSPMPSDDSSAPVNIANPAPEAQPVQSSVISEKPVTIHREKRSSLLERLGWTHGTRQDTDNIAVPPETASQPGQQGAAPAPDSSMSADPMTEPAPPAQPAAESMPPEQPRRQLLRRSHRDDNESQRDNNDSQPQQLAAATPPAHMSADAAMASSAVEAGAMPASATANAATGDWNGAKGQTLRDVLKTWSDKAGVELYWSIDYDYRLSDNVNFQGGYDQAVGSLLDKFATVRPQPYGQLHQSANGPRVLVVKSYDLTK